MWLNVGTSVHVYHFIYYEACNSDIQGSQGRNVLYREAIQSFNLFLHINGTGKGRLYND